MPGKRVCHITTVHPANDVRIFYKECISLVRHGFDVYLIARHDADAVIDGVRIAALPLQRIKGAWRLVNMWRAYRKACAIQAAVYHLHDPELMLVGVVLKLLKRATVVFDVHEDITKHALGKSWFLPVLRQCIAFGLGTLERLSDRLFDAIIVPLDSFKEKYRSPAVAIYNYPFTTDTPLQRKKIEHPALVYVGVIRQKRGVFEMIDAVARLTPDFPDLRLNLIGQFFPASLEERVRDRVQALGIGDHVNITGRMNYTEALAIVRESDVGLAVLHPAPNYLDSLPTKMFEYMLYGKPVIVSNIPLWEQIVRETGCGLTVDPFDLDDMVAKIRQLLSDAELRDRMGRRGREAVIKKYTWTNEEKKLVAVYQQLTGTETR